MTDRIEKLTPEQEAMIPVVRDEWIAHGICTQPANKELAVDGARSAYQSADLAPPLAYVWFSSPLQGAVAAAILEKVDEKKLTRRLEPLEVWKMDELEASLPKLKDDVLAVARSLSSQLEATYGFCTDEVFQAARSVSKSDISNQLYRCGYGQHDAGWLSFYDFFARCGLDVAKKLDGLGQIAKNSGWFWPFEQVCVLTDRPSQLHLDDRNRLHSESTPAIEYRDGYSVYCWHGIRVAKHVIMDPASITVAEIESEENTEVRRVMIDRFGMERFIAEGNFITAHSDTDQYGRNRRLLEKDLPGRKIVLLSCTNSSPEPDGHYKTYNLRCHPELRPMTRNDTETILGEPQEFTCHNAAASLAGMRGEEYKPALET